MSLKATSLSKNSKTRERILEVASRLFSSSGFTGVSMADIAHETGVTKPALYYYFVSKRELYRQSLKYAFQKLGQKMKKELGSLSSDQSRIFNFVKIYLRFGAENKSLIYPPMTKLQEVDQEVLLYLRKAKKRLQKKFQKWLGKVLIQEVKSGKTNLGSVSAIIFGLMTERILENFSYNRKMNVEKEAKSILQKVYSILKLKGRVEW